MVRTLFRHQNPNGCGAENWVLGLAAALAIVGLIVEGISRAPAIVIFAVALAVGHRSHAAIDCRSARACSHTGGAVGIGARRCTTGMGDGGSDRTPRVATGTSVRHQRVTLSWSGKRILGVTVAR